MRERPRPVLPVQDVHLLHHPRPHGAGRLQGAGRRHERHGRSGEPPRLPGARRAGRGVAAAPHGHDERRRARRVARAGAVHGRQAQLLVRGRARGGGPGDHGRALAETAARLGIEAGSGREREPACRALRPRDRAAGSARDGPRRLRRPLRHPPGRGGHVRLRGRAAGRRGAGVARPPAGALRARRLRAVGGRAQGDRRHDRPMRVDLPGCRRRASWRWATCSSGRSGIAASPAEAARACRDHAFDTVGVERVYSIIRDTNLPSQRVARRLGMEPEGSIVKRYRGVDMPHLVFSVARAERGDATRTG